METVQAWLSTIQALLNNPAAYLGSELGPWSYLLLMVLVLIEGPIATLLGAFAASAGLMRPGLVFVSAAAANLTADTLWYSLGYMGKTDWLVKYGRVIRLRQVHIDLLKEQLRVHASRILLLGKLTLSFAVPVLIAAGMARVPWRRYLPVVALGEILWTGSLVLGGFYLRESIKRWELGLQLAGALGAIVFLSLGLAVLARTGKRWEATREAELSMKSSEGLAETGNSEE
jgi:membrane protein DedA with SNARE-associated domain